MLTEHSRHQRVVLMTRTEENENLNLNQQKTACPYSRKLRVRPTPKLALYSSYMTYNKMLLGL